MMSTDNRYPKLRAVDARPLARGGQAYLLLRDPLQLTDKTLMVPQALAPVLALCDGTREDAGALCASLAVRFGLSIPVAAVEELLAALDEVLLLDNPSFRAAHEQVLAAYRAAPFRLPQHAGQSYPANADELSRLLESFTEADDQDGAAPPASLPSPASRGLVVSPHIDFARGGQVYAKVWKRAAELVRRAELVVLLGTDHYGEEGQITLTRQNYATPFGVLPTAVPIVDALAEAMGEERAFAGELHHRGEHSIELASVWLQHTRAQDPCALVPILCGSFSHFVQGRADVAGDASMEALVNAMKKVTAGQRVLVVAAGDLSHVGPAFGGEPLDMVGRARLRTADAELVDRICAGDADGFLAAITRVQDKNNVCGVSPIYLALRMLEHSRGEQVAYDICPADDDGTSVVSVCGIASTAL